MPKTAGSRPAVFLDRDGVLIRAEVHDGRPHPPASPGAVVVLPGVSDACRDLAGAGYALIVVTNQPDIARGRQRSEIVDVINDVLRRQVPVDAIYVCPHDDGDRCGCRKPAPGLLLAAAADHDLDLDASFMVGDRWRDIEAGRAAGCRTILVDHAYRERPAEGADAVVSDLPGAAAWIRSVLTTTPEVRHG